FRACGARTRAADRSLPNWQRHEDVCLDRRPPAGRGGEAEARRPGRAGAAGQVARRRGDHGAAAPRTEERPARLPLRRASLPSVPQREPPRHVDALPPPPPPPHPPTPPPPP